MGCQMVMHPFVARSVDKAVLKTLFEKVVGGLCVELA